VKSRAFDGLELIGVAQQLAQRFGWAEARGNVFGARAKAGAPVQVLKLLLCVHARLELVNAAGFNRFRKIALPPSYRRTVKPTKYWRSVRPFSATWGHIKLGIPAAVLAVPGESAFHQ
jgi:hypothetical protein